MVQPLSDGAGALPQLWKVLVANNPVSDAARRAVTAAYADRHALRVARRVERALSRYMNCSYVGACAWWTHAGWTDGASGAHVVAFVS